MDTKAATPESPSGGKEPEKYIRTFAGDMELVKSGVTPDLAPLTPATAPETPPPPPHPEQVAPLTPLIPAKKPPPEPFPLKTYSGDFTDRMKETRASTATVLAAEQDSATRVSQPTSPEPSRISLPYLLASAALLIAGVVGVYVAYTQYRAAQQPVVVALPEPTPIFVDERETVSGTGIALIQAMQTSVSRPLAAGTVRLLSLTSTTTSVFSALAVSAPEVLLRNVSASGSMAGVIHIAGAQSPFFILSVASYSDTFAGMLAWEPVMPLYLADLFPPYTAVEAPISAATTTTATTTPKVASPTPGLQVVAPTAPPPAIRFFDVTIANHDARVYRDPSGRVVLVYGYWNATTLVIARDAATLTELLTRLATTRTL